MSRNEVDKAKFIEELIAHADIYMIGNISFRRAIKWNEDRYWRIHAVLLAEGKIVQGRGRGGSVGLRMSKQRAA